MRRRPMRGSAGFTLVEVLVAVVVLAIGAAGLIQLLGQTQQQNDRRRGSEVARRLAGNEVQRARSSDPWTILLAGEAERVNANGARDPDGRYRVTVHRSVWCDRPSARPNDTGGPPPPCQGAFAQITIQVWHLRGGRWSLQAERILFESGHTPNSGSWNPPGTP